MCAYVGACVRACVVSLLSRNWLDPDYFVVAADLFSYKYTCRWRSVGVCVLEGSWGKGRGGKGKETKVQSTVYIQRFFGSESVSEPFQCFALTVVVFKFNVVLLSQRT